MNDENILSKSEERSYQVLSRKYLCPGCGGNHYQGFHSKFKIKIRCLNSQCKFFNQMQQVNGVTNND